jgi:hypothetical protein
MRVKRLLAAGAALLLTIWLALPAAATPSAIACGTERWTVKTLQDRPVLIPAQRTTIAYLTSRTPPPSLPDARLPFERHVFTVTGAVVLIRHEADDDYHVVLSDGRRTMITESPAPTCDTRAFPKRQAQMLAARQALRLCSRARVTGVAFFDFEHGQTGVAPNANRPGVVVLLEFVVGAAALTDPLELVPNAHEGSRLLDEVRRSGELLDLTADHGLPFVQGHAAVRRGSGTRGLGGARIVDNGWRLAGKLKEAGQELLESEAAELELFTAERLVEASLRYR